MAQLYRCHRPVNSNGASHVCWSVCKAPWPFKVKSVEIVNEDCKLTNTFLLTLVYTWILRDRIGICWITAVCPHFLMYRNHGKVDRYEIINVLNPNIITNGISVIDKEGWMMLIQDLIEVMNILQRNDIVHNIKTYNVMVHFGMES